MQNWENMTGLGLPQGSNIEPAKWRMKDKGWGEGAPHIKTAHANALWLENVSPMWDPARV